MLRLTQKLAKKIKVVPVAALPPHENPLLDWTANLFMVSRWQCIILTNSASLYSVVFPGKGVPNERALVEQGMKALDDCLTRDGILGLYDFAIAPVINSVNFCKAADKSVLASMNQLVFDAKWQLLERGHPLSLVNQRLNRTPMSKLGWGYAVDELLAIADRSRGRQRHLYRPLQDNGLRDFKENGGSKMKHGFLLLIILFIAISCNNDGPPNPSEPYVLIDTVDYFDDCCHSSIRTYYAIVHGYTPESQHTDVYYNARILTGTQYFDGDVKRIEGTFYNETLYVAIDYFDFLPTGNYELEVIGIEMSSGQKSTNDKISINDYVRVDFDSLGVVQCSYCCTHIGNERHFAGYQLFADDLIGISVDIEAHFGLPCGFSYGSNEYAHMSSLAMIVSDIMLAEPGLEGHRPFANIGIGCHRLEGYQDIDYYIVTEVNGEEWDDAYYTFDYNTYIQEGETYNVKCSLNASEGIWKFFLNDTAIFDIDYDSDPYWSNSDGGTYASFMGEIYNYEDDMPGDPEDSCEFSNCKYMLRDSSFKNIDYNNHVWKITTYDFQWGASRSGPDTFQIWDKLPQSQ